MMLFSRRRKRELSRGFREAEAARVESVGALHAAVIEGQEAERIAADHRRIQQRNHFREIVADAYRGRIA